ncbi:MAG: T9SS type A sorting domain-containing protein [Candidatus Cloacimonetes bacterium]|nr:T9SS type A sorting domain-containing protein [Candidatus Cloacimonadota bacterium]
MKQLIVIISLLIFCSLSVVYAQSLSLAGPATGDQDCMSTGDLSSQIINTYTTEAWIYPTELTGAGTDQTSYGYTVMASSFAQASGYPLWITVRDSEVRVWTFESTATSFHATTGAGIAINTWSHIAVSTTKGGTTTVYVNGVNKLTYTNDGETNWSTILTIGALRPVRPTSNIPFIGMIDEVRVWNDIRTQEEIQDNMYNEIDISDVNAKQGLVGYWSFNDETDPTEDLSDNNNNGDLIQGAVFGIQNPNVEPPVILPVELSLFAAMATNDGYVGLRWITQSETNVAGYYVYRSIESDIATAMRVSPLIPAQNQSTETEYYFVDEEVMPNTEYNFWLQNIDISGNIDFHGPVSVFVNDYDDSDNTPETQPLIAGIQSIYPNPFNPTTTISYQLSNDSDVQILIFNTLGKLVRSFNEGHKAKGTSKVTWDGFDASGNACSSGIYFIQLIADNDSYMSKAVMMK